MSRCILGALLVLLGTCFTAMAAPIVVETSPGASAVWVLENSAITATFSEEMDPASITGKGFTLEKNLGVVAIAAGGSYTVALRGDGTVVDWGSASFARVPTGLANVVAIAAGDSHAVALKGNGTVVAWGGNSYGQATVPAGLANVVAIDAGDGHTVALKREGTVLAWGDNEVGQATVPAGLAGVVAVAAGAEHTVALKGDGTVVAWGYNGAGQRAVPGGLSGVVAIAAGGAHTLALKDDGTVVAWGDNSSGQAAVPAGLTGVTAIAAGGAYSVALKDDGTVVTWGDNTFGQATVPDGLSGVVAIAAGWAHTVVLQGDGTVAAWGYNGTGQAAVPGGLSGVTAITAGTEHTVALKGDGHVAAWGRNTSYGTTVVPAGLSGVSAVAAGGAHTLALKNDGTVVAWGDNSSGQTAVPGGLSGVVAVAAGDWHALALKGDGTVAAWGKNDSGQATVPGGLSGAVAIAAGNAHTVALKDDGTVVAWGKNDYGQATVPGGLSGVTAIAAGNAHTVALKGDGTVVAWGKNDFGQATVPPGLADVTAVAAGGNQTLALLADGTVIVWGNNSWGQKSVPAGVSGVVAIAAGGRHLLALKGDGTVVAWGDNYFGQATVPASPFHAPLAAEVVYDPDSQTATLQPSAPFELPAVYRATIFGRNVSGDPMAGSLVWDFSTGESLGRHFVTPQAHTYGKISPAIGQWVVDGATISFTLIPDSGYAVATATGCDGSLTGSTYTTGPILENCAVDAYFRPRPPVSITVPAGDADGLYPVSWGASPATGVSYVVEEATNPTFTADLRQVYSGPALTTSISGRSSGTVYYYRVKTQKAGYADSDWLTAGNGCAVPGTVLPTPTNIGVAVSADDGTYRNPAVDANGLYRVAWVAAPATPPGTSYVLQQATSSTFAEASIQWTEETVAPWFDLVDANPVGTYYYRVKATRPGYKDSLWKVLTTGCKVVGPDAQAAMPGALTVPVGDADGAYTVNWTASPTKGMAYVLEEATDAAFSDATAVYSGPALKKVFLAPEHIQGTTYFYRVKAVHPEYEDSLWRETLTKAGCAVPGTVLPTPASIGIPVAEANAVYRNPAVDADGLYRIAWAPAATTPADVTYVLQQATTSTFPAAGTTTIASPSEPWFDLAAPNPVGTYYYRVKVTKPGYKDSAWKVLTTGCKVIGEGIEALPPGALTVPAGDADGAYTVSWTASPTKGTTYVLEEATDAAFTADVVEYPVPGLSKVFGLGEARAKDKTYFYRVKAVHPEYEDSPWRLTLTKAGCAVPGTVLPTPASIGIAVAETNAAYRNPAVDADGLYRIAWAPAATTPADVTYVLQQATSSTFPAAGTTTIASPSEPWFDLAAPNPLGTYYYRVKMTKPGYKDSAWKALTTGCKVIGEGIEALPPGALTVPAGDADGGYTVSWTASPTKGTTYVLEEATDAAFSDALPVYEGPALSKVFGLGEARAQDKTYYYRVKAVHPEYTESDWRKTLAEAGCAVPGTTLAVLATLTVPAVDADGEYEISWSASTVEGVTYVLQEATNSTFTANPREAYLGTATTGTITGRNVGGIYYYRVKAVKSGYKESLWKLGTPVKVTGPAPAGVSASPGNGQVTIAWLPVGGATSYNIYWSTTAPVTKVGSTKITGATAPYVHKGLVNGRTYHYVVTAVNPAGESELSAQAAATPSSSTPLQVHAEIKRAWEYDGYVSVEYYVKVAYNGVPINNVTVSVNGVNVPRVIGFTDGWFELNEGSSPAANYVPGQDYTVTVVHDGVTYSETLKAPGGITANADYSQVQWVQNGMYGTLDVYHRYGPTTYTRPLGGRPGALLSPQAIPPSAYPTPGDYTVSVAVFSEKPGVFGTLRGDEGVFDCTMFISDVRAWVVTKL